MIIESNKIIVLLIIIILLFSSLSIIVILSNEKSQSDTTDISMVDLDVSEVEDSFDLTKNWLVSNLKEKGCFNYYYDPSEEEYSTSNNMIRQLMGSRVLAELSQNNDSLKALHQKNLDFMFDYWYREEGDRGYIYYNSKSKLGAIAMALRVLVFSPFFDDYVEEAEKLANAIFYLQNDDGSMEPWYIDPMYTYSSPEAKEIDNQRLLTFYSGEAILGLVDYYLKTNNESILNAAVLSQDYYVIKYVDQLEENYYPAYVPWHTQSLNKLYKITGNKNYSKAIFVLNDKLLELQDKVNNETLGRFYNDSTPEYGSTHSSSDGVYTEGLVYAYEVAMLEDDLYHMELYEEAIGLGVYNLYSLQYTKDNTVDINYPERVIGAIRVNINDDRIRVDTTQHTMDAYMKIFEVFK